MPALLPAILLPLVFGGCVLDRTGKSASEAWHREMLLQRTRTDNLEAQFTEVEARVDQLEELTRARGQEEILRMETLDQLRTEVANIRGEVEVISHDVVRRVDEGASRADDAAFRLQWLEDRAAQLEKSLGLKPTAPPVLVAATAEGGGQADSGASGDTGEEAGPRVLDGGAEEPVAEEVTDPAAMLALANEHLAAGRHKAADAVLSRFLELHPKDGNVAEVRYRLAEAAFNGGEYQSAVLRFQEVIDRHKDSPWAPWAMLRQGECFDKQGQAENARLFYEDVVRIWPKSKAAKEARERL
ncbi:tetratricopeptide repeat protein [Myxococcota bacterium]|nr:tetratricopeptide repeat protein [Myxococcota bacterium]